MADHHRSTSAQFEKSKSENPLRSSDVFNCVSVDGEKISIEKDAVEKIPYLKLYFQQDDPNTATFRPPVKDDCGDYVLPADIDLNYLKPILSYLRSGRTLDLIEHLPISCRFDDLISLMDFLLIDRQKSIRAGYSGATDTGKTLDVLCVISGHGSRFRIRKSNEAAEFCTELAMGSFDLSDLAVFNLAYSCIAVIVSNSIFSLPLRFHAKEIAYSYMTPFKPDMNWEDIEYLFGRCRSN